MQESQNTDKEIDSSPRRSSRKANEDIKTGKDKQQGVSLILKAAEQLTPSEDEHSSLISDDDDEPFTTAAPPPKKKRSIHHKLNHDSLVPHLTDIPAFTIPVSPQHNIITVPSSKISHAEGDHHVLAVIAATNSSTIHTPTINLPITGISPEDEKEDDEVIRLNGWYGTPEEVSARVRAAYDTRSRRCLYFCPNVGCDKGFTRRYNLISHIRSHSGLKPFVCSQCFASFSRNHDLKRHNKSVHEPAKPFHCPMCKQTFSRSDALKRHMATEGKKKGSHHVAHQEIISSNLTNTANDTVNNTTNNNNKNDPMDLQMHPSSSNQQQQRIAPSPNAGNSMNPQTRASQNFVVTPSAQSQQQQHSTEHFMPMLPGVPMTMSSYLSAPMDNVQDGYYGSTPLSKNANHSLPH